MANNYANRALFCIVLVAVGVLAFCFLEDHVHSTRAPHKPLNSASAKVFTASWFTETWITYDTANYYYYYISDSNLSSYICCGGFVDEKLIKLYLQNYNK